MGTGKLFAFTFRDGHGFKKITMKKTVKYKRFKKPNFSAYYRFCIMKDDDDIVLQLDEQIGNNKIFDAIFSSDERYIDAHYLSADPETSLGFQIGSRRSSDDEVVSFDLNQWFGFGYGMKVVDPIEKKVELDNCCHLIFTHPDFADIHVLSIENGVDSAADLAFSFRTGCFRPEINQFLGDGNALIPAIDEFFLDEAK